MQVVVVNVVVTAVAFSVVAAAALLVVVVAAAALVVVVAAVEVVGVVVAVVIGLSSDTLRGLHGHNMQMFSHEHVGETILFSPLSVGMWFFSLCKQFAMVP